MLIANLSNYCLHPDFKGAGLTEDQIEEAKQ